jgi:hypothetical protein
VKASAASRPHYSQARLHARLSCGEPDCIVQFQFRGVEHERQSVAEADEHQQLGDRPVAAEGDAGRGEGVVADVVGVDLGDELQDVKFGVVEAGGGQVAVGGDRVELVRRDPGMSPRKRWRKNS